MELKPGYKLTEMGPIPDDWGTTRLGELASVTAGGTPSRARAEYWNGDIPWITTSEVEFDTIDQAEQFITKEGLQNSAAKLLQPGTLLLALYGQGKTRGKVGVLGIEAASNQACAAISLHQGVSSAFIFHFLGSQYKAIRNLSNTGNQENLNSSLVRSIPIVLPPSTEQEAIAGVLSDADALIDSLEQLRAKKRQLKQGAMHDLLTGKKRLPGFSREWEIKGFGEIAKPRKERVDPRQTISGLYCIELEHIEQATGRLVGVSATSESSSLKSVFHKDDVLFGKLRAYLRKYWLANREGLCSTEIWVLTSDRASVIPEFLVQMVMTDRFIESASSTYGTHMPRSDWNVVKNYQLRLPSVPEQTAISAVLSDMDAEIAALEAKLTKAHAIKQGMMQELLTGRIRLVRSEPDSVQVAAAKRLDTRRSNSHNWQINEAVIIAVLAKHFGSEQWPLGRKRYTKLSYLLHRHVERQVEGYLKKAAGPYNPSTKYRGPETIALRNGYVRRHTRAPVTGLVAAEKIEEAARYFDGWYGEPTLRWLEQFRYETNDDLELLATVDMAMEDLRRAGSIVNLAAVKQVIQAHPEWEAKLNRPIFSDRNIDTAVETCRRLLPSEENER